MTGVWKDSRRACRPALPFAVPETLHILLLRRDGTRIATLRRTGGRQGVALSLRTLARIVAQSGAATLVMVHDHPSGDPRPSAADIAATHAIWRMARMLGATLHDHMIVGCRGTFSFRAHGML
jgi:DNA repair protein RadC